MKVFPCVGTAFLLVLLLLLLALLGLSYKVYRKVFYRIPRALEDDFSIIENKAALPYREAIFQRVEALRSLPWETMTITSRDGLKLYGSYYQQKEGAPLHICVHGYHGTPLKDCCSFVSYYKSLGHNLLLVEGRARMRSEGNAITFGVKESLDIAEWVRACRERFGEECPLILSGFSMGAATVLLASDQELGKSVKGIVADSGYSSPAAIIRKFMVEKGIPLAMAYPLLWLASRLFAHFSFEKSSALESVKETRIPILIFHGTSDSFVPYSMGKEIQEANPEMVTLHTFPGAGHGTSYFSDPERYEAILASFLEAILPRA